MRYFKLILIALLLASCVRPSSTQAIGVIEPTPTPGIENPASTPLATKNAASTTTAAAATLPAAPTTYPTPAANEPLSSQVTQT